MRSLTAWVVAVLLTSPLVNGVLAADAAYGVAAKKPVLGAACANCPWGALADKVKEAMQSSGYDVQICYNCSGADSTRIVSERRVPKPLTPEQIARELGDPPKAPVDFGVVLKDFLVDAYNGTGFYKGEAPRRNLRLIARIEDPNYFLVATRASAFITDLKQIRERRLPVRIIVDNRQMGPDVLEYYGFSKQELESWGGSFVTPADAASADVIIHFGSLNNTPESNLWYQATQRSELRFLQLPDDLMTKLAKDYDWEIGYTPTQYMRGMNKPQKVLITSGTVVYGRDDLPAQFAYDVAKSLDQHKSLLIWSLIPFSYNPDTVWQVKGLPLHPGAERYYRERGYIK